MHDIRHYDTQHKRLICDFVTLSIKALNIASMLSVTIYFIILLNAIMLSVRSYFAEYRYIQCRYAERRGAAGGDDLKRWVILQ